MSGILGPTSTYSRNNLYTTRYTSKNNQKPIYHFAVANKGGELIDVFKK